MSTENLEERVRAMELQILKLETQIEPMKAILKTITAGSILAAFSLIVFIIQKLIMK